MILKILLKVISLIWDIMKYFELNLIQMVLACFCVCTSLSSPPILVKRAMCIIIPFVTTQLCESGFSILVSIKTKRCNHLNVKDHMHQEEKYLYNVTKPINEKWFSKCISFPTILLDRVPWYIWNFDSGPWLQRV